MLGFPPGRDGDGYSGVRGMGVAGPGARKAGIVTNERRVLPIRPECVARPLRHVLEPRRASRTRERILTGAVVLEVTEPYRALCRRIDRMPAIASADILDDVDGLTCRVPWIERVPHERTMLRIVPIAKQIDPAR